MGNQACCNGNTIEQGNKHKKKAKNGPRGVRDPNSVGAS